MANKVDWILKISSVFGTFPLKYTAKMCQVSIILKVFNNYRNRIFYYKCQTL